MRTMRRVRAVTLTGQGDRGAVVLGIVALREGIGQETALKGSAIRVNSCHSWLKSSVLRKDTNGAAPREVLRPRLQVVA